MSQFDDFKAAVVTGAKQLAMQAFPALVTNVETDAQAFLDQTKADLTRWAQELATGKITADEFKDLLAGQEDLAKIAALTQKGIALATAERFRTDLINLIFNSAKTAFKV